MVYCVGWWRVSLVASLNPKLKSALCDSRTLKLKECFVRQDFCFDSKGTKLCRTMQKHVVLDRA